MNNELLDRIFVAVSRLRSAELLLMSRGNSEDAESLRKTRKLLSRAGDRIIASGMETASAAAEKAADDLLQVNSHLQAYLSVKQKADERLRQALEALPAILGLLAALDEKP